MKHRYARFGLLFLTVGVLSLTAPPWSSPVQAFSPGTLRHGSTGSNVEELQSRLRLIGFYHGKTDGIYGWQTYWAVRHFQYRFGMKIDGIAGSATETRLAQATPNWTGSSPTQAATTTPSNSTANGTGPSSSQTTPTASGSAANQASVASAPATSGMTKNDITLIARLVNGEARGEPFPGQVAVAAVILHRIKSPKFPNTVAGVIYQPGAFSAVTDGQINAPLRASSVTAVIDALKGWDPSHGALYYFNPAKTNNAFVWSRPEITKIGHQIFTR